MRKKYNVFYIDPQSNENLYIYDYKLLSNVALPSLYICSSFYSFLPLPSHVHQQKLISYYRFKNRLLQGISFLCSYTQIFFYLVRYRPDIVHTQWLKMPTFEYHFYRAMRFFLGFKLIFTAHNLLPHDTGNRYVLFFQRWYKLADAIIVHTADTKRDLQQLFDVPEKKVHVIMHGILDLGEESASTDERLNELDHIYQIENKIVFSSLGAQSYYKGTDILAEVWADTDELRNNGDLRLVVVGMNNGVNLQNIKKIPNVIIKEERIPNDEFSYLLQHTDVYLLPYRVISQSGALLTAIAAHVPVLASSVGGLKDPFELGRIGWQLSKLSKESLKEIMLHIVNHPEEIKKIKEDTKTWDLVCQHFDWTVIGQKTLKIYEKFIC